MLAGCSEIAGRGVTVRERIAFLTAVGRRLIAENLL